MWDSAVWHGVWTSAMLFVPRLVMGIVVVAVFWIGGRAAQRSAERLAAARHVDPGLTLLFGQLAKIGLLLFGGLLVAWIVERVEDFQARVAQGFSAFRDRPYYLTRVIPFQVLDWTLRITADAALRLKQLA